MYRLEIINQRGALIYGTLTATEMKYLVKLMKKAYGFDLIDTRGIARNHDANFAFTNSLYHTNWLKDEGFSV